jgi:hypothetical protein
LSSSFDVELGKLAKSSILREEKDPRCNAGKENPARGGSDGASSRSGAEDNRGGTDEEEEGERAVDDEVVER